MSLAFNNWIGLFCFSEFCGTNSPRRGRWGLWREWLGRSSMAMQSFGWENRLSAEKSSSQTHTGFTDRKRAQAIENQTGFWQHLAHKGFGWAALGSQVNVLCMLKNWRGNPCASAAARRSLLWFAVCKCQIRLMQWWFHLWKAYLRLPLRGVLFYCPFADLFANVSMWRLVTFP